MSKFSKIAALAATTVLFGGAAFAGTVTITGITATWENAAPGNTTFLSGEGTDTLSWGDGAQQSSYNFSSAATSFEALNPFTLGTFTHNNFPISGTFLTSVDLKLTIEGDIDGVDFSIAPTFEFQHNETSNSGPLCPGDPVPCSDVVTFANAYDDSEVVDVNGDLYTIILSGFLQGGVPVSSFLTTEGLSNSAILQASWDLVPAPVPLPAAGVLLLGAVGGLGALRARRNKRAA